VERPAEGCAGAQRVRSRRFDRDASALACRRWAAPLVRGLLAY
jgi:hypothetical protein